MILLKSLFGFVGVYFSISPTLLGSGAGVFGTLPLEQGSVRVPSQKVAQMTFLGSVWLETQEKVTFGGNRQLLFVSAGRVTHLRTFW